VTSYYLLIVIGLLHVSLTVFEILTFKAGKWLVVLTPPLFDAPAQGEGGVRISG